METYGDLKKTIKAISRKQKGEKIGKVAVDAVISAVPGAGAVKSVYDLVKASFGKPDTVKTDSWLDKLDVDDHMSAIVDDTVENDFLEFISKEIEGEIRSPGHDAVGAEIAAKILTRLGLPRQRRDRIVWAIRHHTFHFSWNLNAPEEASRRQRRFAADPRFPLLLALLRVDAAASLGSSRKMKAYGLYKRLGEMVRKS